MPRYIPLSPTYESPIGRTGTLSERLERNVANRELFLHGDPTDTDWFLSTEPPTAQPQSMKETQFDRSMWRGLEYPGGLTTHIGGLGEAAIAARSGLHEGRQEVNYIPFKAQFADTVLDELRKPDDTFDAEKAWEEYPQELKYILQMNGFNPQQAKDAINEHAFRLATDGFIHHMQAERRIEQFQENAGIIDRVSAPLDSAIRNYFLSDPDTINTIGLGSLVTAPIRAIRAGSQALRAGRASQFAARQAAARTPGVMARRAAARGIISPTDVPAHVTTSAGATAVKHAASAAFSPTASQTMHGALAAKLGTKGALATEATVLGGFGAARVFKEHLDRRDLADAIYGNPDYARPLSPLEMAFEGGANTLFFLGLRGVVAGAGAWSRRKAGNAAKDLEGAADLHRTDPIKRTGLTPGSVATQQAEINRRTIALRTLKDMTGDNNTPYWMLSKDVLEEVGADIDEVAGLILEIDGLTQGMTPTQRRSALNTRMLEFFAERRQERILNGVSGNDNNRIIIREGRNRVRELSRSNAPDSQPIDPNHRANADAELTPSERRVEAYPERTDADHLSRQFARDTTEPEVTVEGRSTEADFQRRQILDTEGSEGDLVQVDVPLERFSVDENADGFRSWIITDDQVDPNLVLDMASRDPLEAPPGYVGRDAETGELVIVDGRHRTRAAMARGDKTVRMYMSEATADAMQMRRARPRAANNVVELEIRNGERASVPVQPARPLTREAAALAERDRALAEASALRDRLRVMRRETETDPLTGILSRRGFRRRAERIFARADANDTPVTVVAGDISQFKALNDVLGHSDGDEALIIIARALREELRAPNAQRGRVEGDVRGVVAREGGDEFAFLLYNTTAEQSAEVIARVRRRINEDLAAVGLDRIEGRRGTRHIRFEGEGVTRNKGESLDDVIARADEKLTERRTAEKMQGRDGEVMTRFDDPSEIQGFTQPRQAFINNSRPTQPRSVPRDTELMADLRKFRAETDEVNRLTHQIEQAGEGVDTSDFERLRRNAARRRARVEEKLRRLEDPEKMGPEAAEIMAEVPEGDLKNMSHQGQVNTFSQLLRAGGHEHPNDAVKNLTLAAKVMSGLFNNSVMQRIISDRTGREVLRSTNRAIGGMLRLLGADRDWRIGGLLDGDVLTNTVQTNVRITERQISRVWNRFQKHDRWIKKNGGYPEVMRKVHRAIIDDEKTGVSNIDDLVDAVSEFYDFFRQEGIRNGTLNPETQVRDMPIQFNYASLRANREKAADALANHWYRTEWGPDGRRAKELHQETLELMGIVRREADATGEVSGFVITEQGRQQGFIPDNNGRLMQRDQLTPEQAEAYDRALREAVDGNERTALNRSAVEYINRRTNDDHIVEANTSGDAGRQLRGLYTRSAEDTTKQRRLGSEVFDDPELAEFFETDMLQLVSDYGRFRAKFILNQSSLNEFTGTRGGRWDAFFDAMEQEALRGMPGERERRITRHMFETLKEKYLLMHGALPEMKNQSDTATQEFFNIGSKLTRILLSAWVPVNAGVELGWALTANTRNPLEFANDMVTMMKLVSPHVRDETMNDIFHGTGYAARISRGDMMSRFLSGDPTQQVDFTPMSRALRPYKRLAGLITGRAEGNPHSSRGHQIAHAALDSAQDSVLRVGGVNTVTEMAAAIRVHQMRRQFARNMDKLERLSELHANANFRGIYDAEFNRQINAGRSKDHAARLAARATGAEEWRLAREAGLGATEMEFAIMAREAGLLKSGTIARLREAGQATGGLSTSRHNADFSVRIAEGHMDNLHRLEARQLQQDLNAVHNLVEEFAMRRVSEGSPFTTPTSPFGRSAPGKFLHVFMNYMGHWWENNAMAVNRMPSANWTAMVGGYMALEGLYLQLRRVMRGESPDDVADDWSENPGANATQIATRVPLFGRMGWIPEFAVDAVRGQMTANTSRSPASSILNTVIGAGAASANQIYNLATGEGANNQMATSQKRLAAAALPVLNTWYGQTMLYQTGMMGDETGHNQINRIQGQQPMFRGTPNWTGFSEEQLREITNPFSSDPEVRRRALRMQMTGNHMQPIDQILETFSIEDNQEQVLQDLLDDFGPPE